MTTQYLASTILAGGMEVRHQRAISYGLLVSNLLVLVVRLNDIT